MVNKISSTQLIEVVNNLIKQKQDAGDGYKDGMNYILQGLKEYIKGPDFVLSEEFKNFALQHYLNNDATKIDTFSQLMELFQIKMSKIGRTSNWDIYPEEIDSGVLYSLYQCFDGINITGVNTDYDRDAITIDLSVYIQDKDGVKSRITINDGGYIQDNDFDSDEEDDYYDEVYSLGKNLNESVHYEVLVLFICLKKLYAYINPTNVEKLLQLEKSKI